MQMAIILSGKFYLLNDMILINTLKFDIVTVLGLIEFLKMMKLKLINPIKL